VRNRANIQEPFCPTQLQLMNTNYAVSIDFLNWPSIRDQCIFKRGEVDVTALVEDIIANTVVEIPEFRAAINVHDAFITRALRQAAGFSSGYDFISLSLEKKSRTDRKGVDIVVSHMLKSQSARVSVIDLSSARLLRITSLTLIRRFESCRDYVVAVTINFQLHYCRRGVNL
jgi:hypothetical protein